MNPFNLEEAKAGKPVVTRDGRDVEILRFDLRGEYPILAVIKSVNQDDAETFSKTGEAYKDDNSYNDLFMKSETKEGWVVVFKSGKLSSNIYATKEEAESICGTYPNFVAVAKIEWEE